MSGDHEGIGETTEEEPVVGEDVAVMDNDHLGIPAGEDITDAQPERSTLAACGFEETLRP